MERRGFLQGLTLAVLGPSLFNTTQAATASTMKDIETMQKNWRTLLAAGFKAPAPGEALKLSAAIQEQSWPQHWGVTSRAIEDMQAAIAHRDSKAATDADAGGVPSLPDLAGGDNVNRVRETASGDQSGFPNKCCSFWR